MFHSVSTDDDVDQVVLIARTIWTEHYVPIIGLAQVEYMLNSIHSKEVISKEISEGNYLYFLIKSNDIVVGYIGIKIKNNELFLSKIYLLSSERGQGIGKLAMKFIKTLALQHNVEKISLTVNRNNTDTIAAYYKFGFVKTGETSVDIGEGFKMDDFLMELLITP